MNSLLATPEPPHQLFDVRLSPSHSSAWSAHRGILAWLIVLVSHNTSNSRKRKADGDEPSQQDDRMASPSSSPLPPSRILPSAYRHSAKRSRSGPVSRPLALPRLLETLDAQELRGLLQQMCSRHSALATEVEQTAPRPSVTSALAVLKTYQQTLHSAFPFGGDPGSDYAYNRVRQPLLALLDALQDFVPHFLPPHELQATQSLQFLDGATEIIHALPDWHSFQNQIHKQNAYDEIAGAWALAVKEAAKRAGGMQLVYGGWDQKLKEHNARSQGRLQEAVAELDSQGVISGGTGQGQRAEMSSIRQEMMNGAYGSNLPVRVGPW